MGRPKKKRTAPKRAISAYAAFVRERRPGAMKEFPHLSFQEVAKKIGQEWKELDNEAKVRYQSISDADKQRYNEEKVTFQQRAVMHATYALNQTGPPGSRRKDKDAPKNPMSSYNFYVREMRSVIGRENPKLDFKELSALVGSRWRTLAPKEKAVYEEMATKDRERYNSAVLEYRSKLAKASEVASEHARMPGFSNPDMRPFGQMSMGHPDLGAMKREFYNVNMGLLGGTQGDQGHYASERPSNEEFSRGALSTPDPSGSMQIVQQGAFPQQGTRLPSNVWGGAGGEHSKISPASFGQHMPMPVQMASPGFNMFDTGGGQFGSVMLPRHMANRSGTPLHDGRAHSDATGTSASTSSTFSQHKSRAFHGGYGQPQAPDGRRANGVETFSRMASGHSDGGPIGGLDGNEVGYGWTGGNRLAHSQHPSWTQFSEDSVGGWVDQQSSAVQTGVSGSLPLDTRTTANEK